MISVLKQTIIILGCIPFLYGQGYSLNFNGSTDYVEIPHNNELNLGASQGTIMVRIKIHDIYEDSYNRIV